MTSSLKKFKTSSNNYEIIRFFNEYPYKRVYNFIKKYNLKETNFDPHDEYCRIDESDVAIMFSGGIDSLSLALRHLEKKESVALLSLSFNLEEQIAATITFKILRGIYGYDKVSIQYIFNEIRLLGGESTYGLTQQPIAAFFAPFMHNTIRESAKTLEIAYCSNDDAISYLPELKTLYNTSFAFKYSDEKYPKIKFPLIKTKHLDNIEYVLNIEKKYNVLFPTFSAEKCDVKTYENNKNKITIIDCSKNSQKENKKCSFSGYIVKEL